MSPILSANNTSLAWALALMHLQIGIILCY